MAMKFYCSHCHKELEEKERVIYFPYDKGRLCSNCYEMYDFEIKFVEQDYNILRGFKNEQQRS